MTPIDILSNPSMPGLIRVKITDKIEQRLEFSDGVPQPFEVELSLEFREPIVALDAFKTYFISNRPNPDRAYFKVSTCCAVNKLKELKGQEDDEYRQLELQAKPAEQTETKRLANQLKYQQRYRNYPAQKRKSTFDRDKLETFVWWAIGITLFLVFGVLGGGDGGDLYDNARQLRR